MSVRVLAAFVALALAMPGAAQLAFERCQVEVEARFFDAECAVLERAENPDDVGGAQIELFVARIPSRSASPAADAMTLIQGGPGGSSVDLYAMLGTSFRQILATRDILLVDQRGTGRSGALRCPDAPPAAADAARRAARRCLDGLAADPRYYTTSLAVADLEAVRAAAGYQQLSIYGVSYGSRVALHYLRRHPGRVRTLVVDGVVPPGWVLGGDLARFAQRAFDALAARCAADGECERRFGDLHRLLARVERELGDGLAISLPDPTSGTPTEHHLDADELRSLVRISSYSTEQAALVPLLLGSALRGDWRPLAAQALLLERGLGDALAIAMHHSVVCSEDYPWMDAPQARRGLERTYMGTWLLDGLIEVCSVWPAGPVDDDFHAPLTAAVPTLILSGQHDPVTPPDNGARLDAMLPQSMHIEVPGHGHGVAGRGCLPQLIARFVEGGTLEGLDASCALRERPLPMFLDAAGPGP